MSRSNYTKYETSIQLKVNDYRDTYTTRLKSQVNQEYFKDLPFFLFRFNTDGLQPSNEDELPVLKVEYYRANNSESEVKDLDVSFYGLQYNSSNCCFYYNDGPDHDPIPLMDAKAYLERHVEMYVKTDKLDIPKEVVTNFIHNLKLYKKSDTYGDTPGLLKELLGYTKVPNMYSPKLKSYVGNTLYYYDNNSDLPDNSVFTRGYDNEVDEYYNNRRGDADSIDNRSFDGILKQMRKYLMDKVEYYTRVMSYVHENFKIESALVDKINGEELTEKPYDFRLMKEFSKFNGNKEYIRSDEFKRIKDADNTTLVVEASTNFYFDHVAQYYLNSGRTMKDNYTINFDKDAKLVLKALCAAEFVPSNSITSTDQLDYVPDYDAFRNVLVSSEHSTDKSDELSSMSDKEIDSNFELRAFGEKIIKGVGSRVSNVYKILARQARNSSGIDSFSIGIKNYEEFVRKVELDIEEFVELAIFNKDTDKLLLIYKRLFGSYPYK